MSKTNVLTIRIPADLKHRISLLAREQGVSIYQLAMYMFSKEIGAIEAGQKIANYWKNHSKKEILNDFDIVMSKVAENPVPTWDEK